MTGTEWLLIALGAVELYRILDRLLTNLDRI